MSNTGKDYRAISDASVPTVEEGAMVAAIRVVLGYARDADDARLLVAAFGFPRESLMSARGMG